MHISKQNKDTMLLTSSTEDVIYVVTFNFCLTQKLKALAVQYPEDYYFIKCTKEGCATFRIKKLCVSIKFAGMAK